MKLSQQMRSIGRTCFGLMWIPFITLFVGMVGMPDGDYAWSELPALTRYSIVLVGFFAITSTALLTGAPIVAGLTNRSVLQNGRTAEARILKIWDTGTTVNNDPMVRMLLEVQPPGEPAFQAEAERLVSRLEIPQIQPGNVVGVKYDPSSRAVALLDAEQGEMSPS